MDKNKKTNAVFLANIEKEIIFRLNKNLKVVSRPIAELGISIISNKKRKSNINYLSYGKKGLFSKPEKESRDTRGLGSKRSILIAILNKK